MAGKRTPARELHRTVGHPVTRKELRAPLAHIRAEAVQASARGTLGQVEKEHILRVLRETDGGDQQGRQEAGDAADAP